MICIIGTRLNSDQAKKIHHSRNPDGSWWIHMVYDFDRSSNFGSSDSRCSMLRQPCVEAGMTREGTGRNFSVVFQAPVELRTKPCMIYWWTISIFCRYGNPRIGLFWGALDDPLKLSESNRSILWVQSTVSHNSRAPEDHHHPLKTSKGMTDFGRFNCHVSRLWSGSIPFWAFFEDQNHPILKT